MPYDINFSLLGAPVDVGAAVTAGYERGRQMRMQGQQDSAFSMLSRDPNSAEGRRLLIASGRPDLARQMRTWGQEDRRQDYTRAAFGGAPVPPALGAATAPAVSAFTPAAAAPVTPAGAPPATVPASPAPMAAPAAPAPSAAPAGPGQLNPQLMQQFFAEDPDGARELLTSWRALNTAQQAEQTRRFTAAVPILSEVARMPLPQRGAAIMSQAAYLVQNGWTPEQVQAFAADPNDQSIRMLLRIGVPIAEQRQFFASIEGGAGQVYRDPITLGVDAANPSPPRTENYYDENGNEMIRTVPGTPAIGPGASLFGAGAQPGQVQPVPPQVGEVRRGYRFRGGDPANPQSWEPAGASQTSATPAWATPVDGGAGPGQQGFR